MVTVNSLITRFADLLACIGGCFGCCTKPTPVIAVDEPSKGLRIQGRIVRKPSISDDFWSSSTYELENNAVQSLRCLLSISASNPTLCQCSSTDGVANPSDFVNHGLIVWNQTRLQWIGSSRPRNHTQQSREPKLRFVTHYFDILCSDMIAVMQEIYGAKCSPSVKVVANLLDSFLYQHRLLPQFSDIHRVKKLVVK